MISNLTSLKTSDSTPSYLSNLNSIRLFIVLAIAFGYCSTLPLGPEYPEMLNLFGYDPSWIGIQVLFFVSGLLALRSIEAGRSGITYLRTRFARNIPLLFTLTVATLIILFPLFGTPLDEGSEFFKRLAKYVVVTTFCISPGQPIQGLMDDARYMCLIQGGIWTLRYGAILHILTAITGRLGWVTKKRLLLSATLFTIFSYIFIGLVIEKNNVTSLTPALTGLRLTYAFLSGMCAWTFKEQILELGQKVWLVLIFLFGMAFLNFQFGPWSPLIDVCLSASFMSLAWIGLWSKANISRIIQNWPDLTLPVMLICWPVAQTLLLLHPQLSPIELIVFTLPLTLVFSLIIHLLSDGLANRFASFKTRKTKTS